MKEILPALNACLNTCAALAMTAGWVAVKRGAVAVHKALMCTAFAFSTLFLSSYLYYHFVVVPEFGETKYAGPAALRSAYYAMLISHIILAIVVVPMVLTSMFHGLRGTIDKHRRIARWTLPVWWYVSVTGIIVYLVLYKLPAE